MSAMDNTYAIIWTATQPGRSGLGTRRFSKDEAEALANQLNEEHEEFLHRAIDLASEDPSAVLAQMRSANVAEAAHIANYPQLVAAEAAAIMSTELVPKLDEKIIWLKPVSEPSAADSAA
jgi:hypothetical protein